MPTANLRRRHPRFLLLQTRDDLHFIELASLRSCWAPWCRMLSIGVCISGEIVIGNQPGSLEKPVDHSLTMVHS